MSFVRKGDNIMTKNNISKNFIETFEPLMTSNSFMRKGKVFHRIVNGKVIQLVSYYSFFMARNFTIQFLIAPLCLGYEFDSNFHGSRLEEKFRGKVTSWFYDGTEGYKEYMPIALKATENLLLPKLNNEIDYESYYRSYRESEVFTRAKRSLIKYKLALVFEDYEDAHEVMEEKYRYWCEVNMEKFGTEYHKDPERQESFEQDFNMHIQIKKAIENNDRKTIEEYISALEQKSLNSYVKTYSTPKKYEKFLETGVLPFDIVYI